MSDKADRIKEELQSQAAADQSGIYEEYMKLLSGGRVSSRRSQTQSVMERNRQEQLNQLQQQQRRQVKKTRRGSGRPPNGDRDAGGQTPVSGQGDSLMDQVAGSGFTSMSRKRGPGKNTNSNNQLDMSGDESSHKGVSVSAGSRLKQRREGKSTRKSLQSGGTKGPKFKSSKDLLEHGEKPTGDASVFKRRKNREIQNKMAGQNPQQQSMQQGKSMIGSGMMPKHHHSVMNFSKHTTLGGSARGAFSLMRGQSYIQEESNQSSVTSGLISQKGPQANKFFKSSGGDDDQDEEDQEGGVEYARITGGDASDDDEHSSLMSDDGGVKNSKVGGGSEQGVNHSSDRHHRRSSQGSCSYDEEADDPRDFARPHSRKDNSTSLKAGQRDARKKLQKTASLIVAGNSSSHLQQQDDSQAKQSNQMQQNQSQVSINIPVDGITGADFERRSRGNSSVSSQERQRSRNKKQINTNDTNTQQQQLVENASSAVETLRLPGSPRGSAPNAPRTKENHYRFESPTSRKLKQSNSTEMINQISESNAVNTQKRASGVDSAQRDIIWRQLDELKALDKVFPDPSRTVNCYVQMQSDEGQQKFGKVEACKVNESIESPSIADYKLQVKPTIQGEVQTISANKIKYLARAYLCKIADLSTEKMPHSLLEALNLTNTEAENEEGKQIVLIQTISTKVQQHVQQITTEADQQQIQPQDDQCLSEGNSSHRFHALVARIAVEIQNNNEEEGPKLGQFTLYPVVFKPSQTRNRKTKVPLSIEAPEELNLFLEENSLCYKDEQVCKKSLQFARIIQKAFIQKYLSKISNVRLTRQNIGDHLMSIVQFNDYKQKISAPLIKSQQDLKVAPIEGQVEKIEGTEEQQDKAVVMLDSTTRGDVSDISVGIVTNYKVVVPNPAAANQDQNQPEEEILLFVSLFISGKSRPGRTTAWVPLNRTKVYADLSLGLVSQKWLEKFQIHDSNESQSAKHQASKGKGVSSTPQKASAHSNTNKLRQLQMLNWQESQTEKSKTLKLDEIGTTTINKEKEGIDQKMKDFVSDSATSRASKKIVVRQAEATTDFSKESNCKICFYIINAKANPQVKVLNCSRCNRKYHMPCLQPHERNISNAEQNWRCPDCQRCSNCKSQQCQEQLMTCLKCNTPTHYDCLPSSYRQSLRPLYTVTTDPDNERNEIKKLNVHTKRFRCQDCIKCQNCDSQEAGPKRNHKWSKDFKLCASCNKMREKRLFCPICERFQPSETEEERSQAIESAAMEAAKGAGSAQKQQNLMAIGQQIVQGEKMIKCRGCAMLVHVDCDRMLAEPATRRQIMPDRIEGEVVKFNASNPQYKCPNCRRANRNSILEQIIEVLIASDKQEHFLLPFWESMQPQARQEYLDIIKRKPVCFSGILQEIRANKRYLQKPEDFWKDIERAFVNAKAYNDSPEVYNAASLLHEKANQFLKNKKLKEVVEVNARATQDESRVTLFMRKIAKELRKGIIPSGSVKNQKPSDLKVTAKEMLQGSEVPDLRVFGISGSVLDCITQQSSNSQDAGSLMFYQATAEQIHSQVVKKSKLPAHKQWEKLMEDLQTNDERDTCWYPNPIKISFDDPALIFEEMCYLCGSFGNQEDFLCCNLCGESFHPYCLPDMKNGREQFQDYWRCYNCMFCEKCHSSKQWEGLLICAVCDKVDHFWCLEPQLIQVPECNWKCPECFKCAKCGTKSFFSEKDIENKVNLDPNEKFVLSFDFELCYQCGQDEYRKSYCSICNLKTGFGLDSVQGATIQSIQKVLAIDQGEIPEEVGLLKCNQCGLYSHLACSKTDIGSLQRHAQAFNQMIKEETGEEGNETAKSIYKCIDCLLIDRLPSFYIHHQCELYESLHQSMQRHALLRSLVETILAKYMNVADPSLYVTNFISHNQKVFREDRLICQWLALLEGAPSTPPQTQQMQDTLSCTEMSVDQQQQQAPKPSQPNDTEELKQSATDVQKKVDPTTTKVVDLEMKADKNQTIEGEEKAQSEKVVNPIKENTSNPEMAATESPINIDSHERIHCFNLDTNMIQVRDSDIVPSYDSENDQLTKSQRVYQDLYGHKTGFMPIRRDLYENLLRKENNRAARQDFFEALDDLPDKITVPTDETIRLVDLNELFVKIELRAILKIQIMFQQWVQQLVQNTVGQFSEHFATSTEMSEDASNTKRKQQPQLQTITTTSNDALVVVEQSEQIEFCQEADVLVENPQKRLKCLLCGLNGERSITGRLIPFQINQFVHVNCAMWTQEVQEGQEENDSTRELYNFYFAYNEFKHYVCDFCGESGATIFCSNRGQKRCPAAFHFPCAYSSRKVAFLLNTDIYCESCIPKTPEAIPGFPIEFRNYPKRRIIIVRNIEPQCTMAFQNQIRKSNQAATAQQQAMTASGMPMSKIKGLALENEQSVDSSGQPQNTANSNLQQMQQSQNSSAVAAGGQAATAGDTQGNAAGINQQNGQDVGVIIACNKWRPYYYDMFNRVGNLTLLSLSRRRNSIIESLHTFTHENRNWHERFNLRFPEEEQSDFASIRIYWDYQRSKDQAKAANAKQTQEESKGGDAEDVVMKEDEVMRPKGPPSQKGYYLFTNSHVQWVPRHNYTKIKQYINRRLHEYTSPLINDLNVQVDKVSIPAQYLNKFTIEQFWLMQIANLAERYPLFCQDNTYQTSKVMSGVEKFPIQYWNNPGEKLGGLTTTNTSSDTTGVKGGLELKDLGVAGFFFKSGYKLLEAQKMLLQNSTGGSKQASIGGKRGTGENAADRRESGNATNLAGQVHGAESGQAGSRQTSRKGDGMTISGYQGHSTIQASIKNDLASSSAQQQPNNFTAGQAAATGANVSAVGGPSAQQVQITTSGQQQASASTVKNTSLESIFRQILEANQVNDQKTSPLIVSLATHNDKNEDSSEDSTARKDLSTKVMNYEQIMACLGKQTLKVKQEERRKVEDEKARLEQLKQQQMQIDAMYGMHHGMYSNEAGGDADPSKSMAGGQLNSTDGADEGGNKDSQKNGGAGGTNDMGSDRRRKGSKMFNDLNDTTNKGSDINAAMKYRDAKARPKVVEVWISKIHRNGLFACQSLNPKDIVIEYVGEKIRDPVADKRETVYSKLGVGDCYNFRLNKDYIIDATFFGSKARYINHSCEPNLISEYQTVNGETHIIFVAARKIHAGEELTFDYNFMPEIESIECFCGSEKCRGRLA